MSPQVTPLDITLEDQFKKAEITRAELLMMAETIGEIQHELQWLIEWVRTKSVDLHIPS